MNLGQWIGLAWDVVAWFFIVSVFLFPISFAYWKAREREDAEETERVLGTLGFDRSHAHEQDAL